MSSLKQPYINRKKMIIDKFVFDIEMRTKKCLPRERLEKTFLSQLIAQKLEEFLAVTLGPKI